MINRELGHLPFEGSTTAEVYATYPFVVQIDGTPHAVFTECTLPNLEVEVEEVKEGGFNAGTHLLPGRVKKGSIILKRGLVKSSRLLEWYRNIMQGKVSDRRNVSVIFYDSHPDHRPRPREVIRWNFEGAYPHKWTGPLLKTDSNEVAIETLEFSFESVTVE